MSYVTASATDAVDLFNKLRDFLTTDAGLTGVGQNWTQLLGNTGALVVDDSIFLRGPGFSGTDNIYVGANLYGDAISGVYGLKFWSSSGYDSGLPPDGQPNQSEFVYLPLSNIPMTYWFFGNGRRFIIVVKMGSSYYSAYMGFGLPYATSTEYPYPMFVGGTSYKETSINDTSNLSFFCDGLASNFPGSAGESSASAFTYYPTNVWLKTGSYGLSFVSEASTSLDTFADCFIHPYSSFQTGSTLYVNGHSDNYLTGAGTTSYDSVRGDFNRLPDGDFLLTPASIVCRGSNIESFLMELDGVFHVPGSSLTNESVFTIGPDQYIAFGNINRTDTNSFMALRMD